VAVAVAARQRLHRRPEEQAPKPAAVPVRHEVAHMRPEGAAVAEMVVAVDERVPELPAPGVRHDLQPRCPRTVLASPVRLSSGKGPTVSRMSA